MPGGGAAPGVNGAWDGIIGRGGGGGNSYGVDALYQAGGGPYNTVGGGVHVGGKGSYSVSDPGFSAPGSIALPFSFTYDRIVSSGGVRSIVSGNVATLADAIGGVGGGARSFPIDGSLAEWGTGGIQGFCLIRLTYLSL